jgi:hypothetical protein
VLKGTPHTLFFLLSALSSAHRDEVWPGEPQTAQGLYSWT